MDHVEGRILVNSKNEGTGPRTNPKSPEEKQAKPKESHALRATAVSFFITAPRATPWWHRHHAPAPRAVRAVSGRPPAWA